MESVDYDLAEKRRTFALEKAVQILHTTGAGSTRAGDIIEAAKKFEAYLKGKDGS